LAINKQDLLNAINKASLSHKIAAVAIISVGLTAANYFLVVSPDLEQIRRQHGVLRQLEDELIQKQSIANNLAQFKHEKEILERRLQQALTELPNEANIDELIRSFAEVATKSGLTINDITPQPEVRQSFYASIPIVMTVNGNYHEIGVFLDSLSKLARIVNVTNIRMGSPKQTGEKLAVNAQYVATTFRFLSDAAQAPPQVARGAKK
jgi:type IV pilus assembly protein PilO